MQERRMESGALEWVGAGMTPGEVYRIREAPFAAGAIASGAHSRDNTGMANIKRPEGMEIAALREKQAAFFDLMTPGQGTPWEERGNLGLIVAFFKTAWASMFTPVKLAHLMRRPETMTDTRGFLFGCSFFWAACWAIHSTFYYYKMINEPRWFGDPSVYFFGVGIKFAAGFVAPLVLLKIYCSFYYKLIATEFQKQAPVILIQNVKAYCFGPSLLAIVPFAGPPLALLWIFISFCRVGVGRLRLSKGGAIVGTVISMLATLALLAGAIFALDFVFTQITGGGLEDVSVRHE